MILGPDGMRMSKSRGNVVNPDKFLEKFGSDAFRCYLMFGFEFEKGGPWSDEGIASLDRFLNRIWRFFEKHLWVFEGDSSETGLAVDEQTLYKILHRSLKGVTEDTERFHFNTAISRIMELVNGLYRYAGEKPAGELNKNFLKMVLEKLIVILSPFAPYLAEELWERTGHEFSVFQQSWPQIDEKAMVEEVVNYGVLINGKVRAQMKMPKDAAQEEIEETALETGRIPALLEGKTVRKIIVVPNKVVNIVAN